MLLKVNILTVLLALKLHSLLEDKLIKVCMPIKSALARQKLWEKYHHLCTSSVIKIWSQFYDDMCIEDHYDVLVAQMTTDQLVEDMLKFYCETDTSEQAKITKRKLSDLEKNVIRYAGGYVPRSLIKQYESRKEKKYVEFIDCLLNMSAESDDTSNVTSFYEYTKEWTATVNRGGLFVTNDASYMLFTAIETTLQPHLQLTLIDSAKALNSDCCNSRERLVSIVTADEDVSFHWCLCSLYITVEEDSQELLKEIVDLWLNIRGYSTLNQWVEKFKWEKHSSAVKEKGLRKRLKSSAAN